MQHVVFRRHGPPEVLTLEDRALPDAGTTDVVIAVRAAGVNFADVMARMGLYPDAPKPPLTLGYEVAGVVEHIGASVTGIQPGDRVVALTRFNGYATHVVVPAAYVFPTGDVSDTAAAALPVNYLTASLALYRLANLSPGETVLIHGAGGGVGIAAIQLARLRHARIIGTASPLKHDALRALGIDHAIDSRNSRSDLLAPLGRLVVYGVSAVAPRRRRSWWRAALAVMQMPGFKPLSLMNRNRGVLGLNLAHLWDEREQLAAAMRPLLRDLHEGRLQPVVARTFPLEHAAAAHDFLQSRANIGKVVLTV